MCSKCSRWFQRKDILRRHQNVCESAQSIKTNDVSTGTSPQHTAQSSGQYFDEPYHASQTLEQFAWRADLESEQIGAHYTQTAIDCERNWACRSTETSIENGALNLERRNHGEGVYVIDADAAFYFDDDLNLETIEQLLETLAGYDELGRVEIDRWPRSDNDPGIVSLSFPLGRCWFCEQLLIGYHTGLASTGSHKRSASPLRKISRCEA
jgi:hypothetical protein